MSKTMPVSRTSTASELSLVVLTYNEERNIRACLESARALTESIFVVDSGSADDTVSIAKEFGARFLEHPFETHAKQWEWALKNLPVQTEWVLGLDADQSLTPELSSEIRQFLSDPDRAPSVAGCFIKRRQIFRGKWIRHGGYYPKYLLKLFRMDAVAVGRSDFVDHHFSVDGPTIELKHDLIEDNRNEHDFSVWIEKHNRYSSLQALEEYAREKTLSSPEKNGRFRGSPDQRTMWMKRQWRKMPLYVRPLLYFLYRYFFRLGFLDGKEGLVFHFMQGLWYRLLVDIKLDELRSGLNERTVCAGSETTGSVAAGFASAHRQKLPDLAAEAVQTMPGSRRNR